MIQEFFPSSLHLTNIGISMLQVPVIVYRQFTLIKTMIDNQLDASDASDFPSRIL